MRKPKKSSPTRRRPQPKRKEVMPNTDTKYRQTSETRPRPSALAAGAAHLDRDRAHIERATGIIAAANAHLDGIDREIARIVANLRAPDSRSLLPQNEFV